MNDRNLILYMTEQWLKQHPDRCGEVERVMEHAMTEMEVADGITEKVTRRDGSVYYFKTTKEEEF